MAEPASGRKDLGNLASNVEFLEKTRLLETPRRILEIGCGQGNLALLLKEQGHEIAAVDVDPDSVANSPPGLTVLLASGDELPFADASFDLVLSFDVFEHIPDWTGICGRSGGF